MRIYNVVDDFEFNLAPQFFQVGFVLLGRGLSNSRYRNPDKAALRERIFQHRTECRSFREITREVGWHCTGIQQTVNGS